LPRLDDDAEGRGRADHHGPGPGHHRGRRGRVIPLPPFSVTVDPGSSKVSALVERARRGDRVAIAKLISLVESGGESARAVVAATGPHTGRAWTVGITGAPGAGKSTLTDGLVRHLREAEI